MYQITQYISEQNGIYCVTAAVLDILPTATARAGLTRCGARTRDHRREATLLLLLVLESGAAVAVVWEHARTQELYH